MGGQCFREASGEISAWFLADIVGKKRDHRILDPLIFSGKIRKNRKNPEKYFLGKFFRKYEKNSEKYEKNSEKYFEKFGKIVEKI